MTSAIPNEALDKHVALLGMTGAGKTSVIKAAIVEPDLEAERRVLIGSVRVSDILFEV